MATKEELAAQLARKRTKQVFRESLWSDLVNSIQSATPSQRDALVQMLIHGEVKKAGDTLRNRLFADAKARAAAQIDAILADDNVSLAELDDLLG